jgi:hypothetical protein
MAAHGSHEDDEPDWVVIAQAEGILAARDGTDVAAAAAALRDRARTLGVPVDQLARDLVRSRRSASGEDG